MNSIECDKCSGKVFVDTTFMENANYELFCIMCGKRDFVGFGHPLYPTVYQSVKKSVA